MSNRNADLNDFLGDGYQPGGSCTSDDERIRAQFRGSEELRTAIGEMLSAFKEWGPVQQRANDYAYLLLGHIYAACPLIEKSQQDKGALITEVRKHKDVPDIRMGNRWDPYRKKPEELFLALIFGLKQEKEKKSQWLKAIRAAEAAQVERSVEAFIQWIKGVGGIVGAGRTLSDSGTDHESAFATLVQFINDTETVQHPITITLDDTSIEFPNKLGVIIVRQLGQVDQFQPLATLSDQRLIAAAIEAYQKERKRLDKEAETENIRDYNERWRRPASKKWFRFTKEQREILGPYEDWLKKGRPFDLDSLPEA